MNSMNSNNHGVQRLKKYPIIKYQNRTLHAED